MLKYIAACACCNHEKREEIDQKILSGKFTQKSLAVEYNVSEQSISNHKNRHVLDGSENVDRLKLMVQRALAKDLEPDNVGELVRLLEYHDKLNKCEECEYRLRADRPVRTVEQALAEFLSED